MHTHCKWLVFVHPPSFCLRVQIYLIFCRHRNHAHHRSELPTKLHALLGVTLFLFGNITAWDPSLTICPHEPSSPSPFWLAVLDVLDIGNNPPTKQAVRMRSLPFPWPFLCGLQRVSGPYLATFIPDSDVPIPLRSPEVSAPYLIAFSPCPDVSLLLVLLQWCLDSMPGPALQWHFTPACLTICPRLQCLGFFSNGFLSLASRFNTGGTFSHGKCSAQDLQCFPLLVCANAWGSNFPCIHVGVHSHARLPARPRGLVGK